MAYDREAARKAFEEEQKQAAPGRRGKQVFMAEDLEALGIDTWQPSEGSNFITLLPYGGGDPKYCGLHVWVHHGIGPGYNNYLCKLRMRNTFCPICGQGDQNKDEDGRVPREYRPRHRVLFFIIDMKDRESVSKGIQFYDSAASVNDEILAICKNRRTGEVIVVSDPEDGRTIVFNRKGKGLNDDTTPPETPAEEVDSGEASNLQERLERIRKERGDK